MKKIIIVVVALVLIIGIATVKKKQAKNESLPAYHIVEKGDISFQVYATGNLEAENSTSVDAPNSVFSRELRIWDIAITDLVDEGTPVDSGDYIASLDQNTIQESLVSAEEELELAYNSLTDAQMDSNLTLNNKRDAIITAQENVEEKELSLAESQYESPATIQKIKMDRDKALRMLEQQKQSYLLQQRRSRTQVMQKELDYERKLKRVNSLKEVIKDIVITAPQKGMVIYYDDHGSKRSIGSTVNAYSRTIATLPDLSTMISIAYVNEIDISQVKENQEVELSVDAFPNKILKGKVVNIANIGKTIKGSDAKVFEVTIKVLSTDKSLRPAMTTNNVIFTGSESDTIFIPTETIFSNDSMNWVYVKGRTDYKQIVSLGRQSENYSIIEAGLSEGMQLMWTTPENAEDLAIRGEEIYQALKEKRIAKERKAQKEADRMSKQKFKKRENNTATGGTQRIRIR